MQNDVDFRIYIPKVVVTKTSYHFLYFHANDNHYYRMRHFGYVYQHSDHWVDCLRISIDAEDIDNPDVSSISFGTLHLRFRIPFCSSNHFAWNWQTLDYEDYVSLFVFRFL